jgi:hypothetical protein
VLQTLLSGFLCLRRLNYVVHGMYGTSPSCSHLENFHSSYWKNTKRGPPPITKDG